MIIGLLITDVLFADCEPRTSVKIDRPYPILRVERLPFANGETHFILRIWEGINKEGLVLLPLHDVLTQNEIICINRQTLHTEMILRELDFSNNPFAFSIILAKYSTCSFHAA